MRAFKIIHLMGFLSYFMLMSVNGKANDALPKSLTVLVNDVESYHKYFYETILEPFQQQFDVTINLVEFKDDYSQLTSKKIAQSIDVVDLQRENIIYACQQGWLKDSDWFNSASSLENESTPVNDVSEFIEKFDLACGIGHAIKSVVYGYDRNTFATNEPSTIKDFFNVQDFPGQRLIKDDLLGILEWTLLSHDVPKAQVYSLLSTDRGLDLAFKKLESIRDSIVWWHDEQEVFALLKSKEPMFVMASNEILFEAEMKYGLPVNLVWDNNLSHMQGLALVENEPDSSNTKVSIAEENKESLAKQYIRFMVEATHQAALSNVWPFSPTNMEALPLITNHPIYQVPMIDYLPSSRNHLEFTLLKDTLWYRRANKIIKARFKEWLEK